MTTVTMLDRAQAPSAAKAVKALAAASQAAKTPGPGAWAFYLGGPGHNRGRGSTYTNALLDDLETHGIRLLPIFVGRQRDLSRDRGIADAKAAMILNRTFGSRASIIAADIEQGTSDRDPAAAVAYVSGWTGTLHAAGLRAMVYGSFKLANDVSKHCEPRPDAIWVARYRAHGAEARRDPHHIPGIPEEFFQAAGQRAWQYGAEFRDHPDDTKPTPCHIEGINVDVSSIDVEVFGAHPASAAAGPPPMVPAMRPAPVPHTHVVRPGDRLSTLEVRFHLPQGSLFAANREALDADARRHGKANSNHGNLIFPGLTLRIPTA